MDGFLYLWVEVLDAEAESIKAEVAQNGALFRSGRPGIDFYSDFGIRGKVKLAQDTTVQFSDLVGFEIGWSATAPVQLLDAAACRNTIGNPIDFLFDMGQVWRGHFMGFGDKDVAPAVETQRAAEWNMEIQ